MTASAWLGEPGASDAGQMITKLLSFVFQFRRTESRDDPCVKQPCPECFDAQRDRVWGFVQREEPVHFVLPAFPAKSANTSKVLGPLPDLGERLAVDFLQSFCENVQHIYPHGARITICSDGHVFSDVLGIPDDDVTAYRDELQSVISATGGRAIDLYSLEDAFDLKSWDDMRTALVDGYATPVEEIKAEVRSDVAARSMFNGMHRFMVEDQTPLHPELSRTKVRLRCKDIAYTMIQRSRAWGDLVGDRYPESLRLSIHPQACHAEKIGFHMLRTKDAWLTPWHGVVIDDGVSFTLVKRHQADAMGASMVWRNGRPSHYVNPVAATLEIAS